ncbi:hypothetical protein M378DRAFT_165869 [Amanita muscaria Koide BX008]|uniref:Uncharacterized protein n=1 Tax=Amanita muscaria (strain Koide BX008) TaxID=946122 RepID=A0A0C2WZM7_AMAMK|nr:hypothetical protein M378DRAFT_165869 [Amanita muscaria Koide BX008]
MWVWRIDGDLSVVPKYVRRHVFSWHHEAGKEENCGELGAIAPGPNGHEVIVKHAGVHKFLKAIEMLKFGTKSIGAFQMVSRHLVKKSDTYQNESRTT